MRRTAEEEELDLLERQRGHTASREPVGDDPLNKDDEPVMDPALQKKLILQKVTHWTTVILTNTNAAIVAVTISAPVVLMLTIKMNYLMAANENITSVTALLSLSFGFLMSAFISGHPSTFKSFTLTQAAVMMIQISRYGIGAVGSTTVVVGLIIVVCYVASVQRQLDLIPTCVIFGLKLSIGAIMLISELPRAFGLPSDPIRESRSSGVLAYLMQEREHISWLSFSIFATFVVIFSVVSSKAPKYYWQALFLVAFLIGGYFLSPVANPASLRQAGATNPSRRTLLGDDWGVFRNFQNKFQKIENFAGIPHQPIWMLVMEPAFLINCGALAFMTLVEATSLAKLVDFSLKTTSDKKKEMLGLGLSNILAGVLGFFPVSLPVGRNLVVIQAGANSPIFGVIAAILTVLVTYFLWGFFQHLPMLAVSIVSATLAVTLLDIKTLLNYWKYSPAYAAITTGMAVGAIFVNHFLSMLLAWCLFLVMYSRADDIDNYGPGDIEFIVQEARIFECVNQHLFKRGSLHGEERESTMVASVGVPLSESLVDRQNLVGWNSHTHDILQKVATEGAIYELRGRFNFLHSKTHLANIRRYHKAAILVDFRKVFEEDIEFVLEYQYFISSLAQEPFAFYVTGIPYHRVHEDLMLKGTWIEKLNRDNQIIFIN